MQERKILTIVQFVLVAMLLLPVMACADREADHKTASGSKPGKVFEENVQYAELFSPVPVSTEKGKIEVVEVFWYGCPHCFHLEPYFEKWNKSKAKDVELVRMPGILGPSWKFFARAFYAAQVMGVSDKLHKALFEAIHEQHRKIRDEDSLIRFVESQDIDPKAFREAMSSMAVDTKVARAGELGKLYGVTGVPALIVGGKYRVLNNGVQSYQEIFDVVNFLADKVREEAKGE